VKHQDGHVYREGKVWFGRWRENVVQADGSVKRMLRCRKLADYCDRYRSEGDVRPLLQAIIAPLANDFKQAQVTMQFGKFVDDIYLPHAEEQLQGSTFQDNRRRWKLYLAPVCSTWWVRDVRCCDVQNAMNEIARHHDISRPTLRRIKAVLSAMFKLARQRGYFDGINPCTDVAIPKAREGEETYAYSFEEIMAMIARLPEPASIIVAVAAFTGLRRGEIRGLQWESYDGSALLVTRSIFNGVVSEPKTRKSKAAVPVIAPLRAMLDSHRITEGNPQSGPMFTNNAGRPLDLNNLTSRVVIPALQNSSIQWHGWHAFRRGLATNLNRVGVPMKTIQAILRHANLSTTANIYVKSVDEDSVKAMQRLESVLFSKCSVNLPATPANLLN